MITGYNNFFYSELLDIIDLIHQGIPYIATHSDVVVPSTKGNMPDIFWDGVLPLSEMIFGQPKEEKLVLSDNGEATFLAIKPIKFMLSLSNPITRDQSPYLGEIRALSPVIIDLPEGI